MYISKCDFYVSLMRNWIWWYDLFKPLTFPKYAEKAGVMYVCVLSFWLIMECFKAWQHLWSRLCHQNYAKNNSKMGVVLHQQQQIFRPEVVITSKCALSLRSKYCFISYNIKFQWTLPISLKAKISHKSCYN